MKWVKVTRDPHFLTFHVFTANEITSKRRFLHIKAKEWTWWKCLFHKKGMLNAASHAPFLAELCQLRRVFLWKILALSVTVALLVSVVVFRIRQRIVRKVSTIVSQVDSFSIFKMAVENLRSIWPITLGFSCQCSWCSNHKTKIWTCFAEENLKCGTFFTSAVCFLLWFLWCKYLKLQRSMVEWWVNDKLERGSKEEVLPQLKHFPCIWLELPVETSKALSQSDW
jgi:hypothetical protein